MLGDRLHQTSEREREAIFKRLQEELLGGHSEIAFAYLYGSFLESPSFHDIDVGIYLADFDAESVPSIDLELSKTLTRSAGAPVEVRVLNDAPITFLFHVLRGHLLVSHDEALRTDTMESVMRTYFDLEPFLRRCAQEAMTS